MDYKQIKAIYNLTDEDIAKIFGYKNSKAFTSSSASHRIKKAVEGLFEIFVPNLSHEEFKKKSNG